MVVDYVGEVVGGQFVGLFPEHLVVEGRGVDLDVPAYKVVHLHDAVLGHLEPYGPVIALLQQPGGLRGVEGQGVAHLPARGVVVDEGLAGVLGLRAHELQVFGAVEGVVGIARPDELFRVLAVDAAPLALAVGGVGVALRSGLHHVSVRVHALVRRYAAPFQGFNYILLGSGHEAVGVCVLYPEYEIAAMLFGVQIVVERRADSSHVEGAGG